MSSHSSNIQNEFEAYNQIIQGSDLSIDFVPVKGGTFLAGSPESELGRKSDEAQHQVTVSDFWMSTVEVTWDQFELFLYRELDSEISKDRQIKIDIDGISGATMPYVNFNKPGFPLINITQHAASTFCKWLSAKSGQFYRLPTEAEWEYASRGGSQESYNFDVDQLDQFAWFSENSNNQLQKGGLKQPNALGLYDMHGNAAEWVIDGYDANYKWAGASSKDPVLFTDKLYPRVVRGGSYRDGADGLRAAARAYSDKSWKKRDPQIPKSLWWLTDATHVGFRIVRPRVIPPKEDWEKYWGVPIEEY